MDESVVESHGVYASSCGYCGSKGGTSVSYGNMDGPWLHAHSLSVYDYQGLLDRGWRRSGTFLYKPEMERTCCPAYTIRLRTQSFQISREQSRVLRRMQRYLDGTYEGGIKDTADVAYVSKTSNEGPMSDDRKFEVKRKVGSVDDKIEDLSTAVKNAMVSFFGSNDCFRDLDFPEVVVHEVKPSSRKRIKSLTGDVLYTCNIAFPCAAMLLKQNDLSVINKVIQQGDKISDTGKVNKESLPVLLAEQFASCLENHLQIDEFQIEACKGHLNFISRKPSTSDSGEAVCSYSSPSSNIVKRIPGSMRRKRILEIRMRRSAFDPEEFALYKRYQIGVHHDKPENIREGSYVRFLVNTPLQFIPPSESESTFCGFGSFHQQYLIDGCLVAVGVVDILPNCLSSKYLFWDPDLSFLSLGKYSALREIEWVKNAHSDCSTLEYYYLGYYIHSCPKMRYKGDYQPSELLCPVRFQWVPFDLCLPLLNRQPFVCLSDILDTGASAGKEDISSDDAISKEHNNDHGQITATSNSKALEDVSNVLLKLGNQHLKLKDLQEQYIVPQKYLHALVTELRKYNQAVGSSLSTRMAYLLN